jgi:NADH dehydrogenase (ubiquinone) flavoprotein 1
MEARVRDYAQKAGGEPLAGGWAHDAKQKGLLIAPGQWSRHAMTSFEEKGF